MLKSDWPSTALISALMGQFNRTVRAITRALKWLFFTARKKKRNLFFFVLKNESFIS